MSTSTLLLSPHSASLNEFIPQRIYGEETDLSTTSSSSNSLIYTIINPISNPFSTPSTVGEYGNNYPARPSSVISQFSSRSNNSLSAFFPVKQLLQHQNQFNPTNPNSFSSSPPAPIMELKEITQNLPGKVNLFPQAFSMNPSLTKSNNRAPFACSTCFKHKSSCDGQRPCARCLKTEKAESCCDRERKQYTKKRKHSDNEKTSPETNSKRVTTPDASTTPISSIAQLENSNQLSLNIVEPVAQSQLDPTAEELMDIQSETLLKTIASHYPATTTPSSITVMRLFCCMYAQMTKKHFAKLLNHFGYKSHSIEQEREQYYKFSSWIVPEPINGSQFPPLPDCFQQLYEQSPTQSLPDSPPFIPNIATLILGDPCKLKHIVNLINSQYETSKFAFDSDSHSTHSQTSSYPFRCDPNPGSITHSASGISTLCHNNIVVVNREFERMFGYTQTDIRYLVLRGGAKALYAIIDMNSLLSAYRAEMSRFCDQASLETRIIYYCRTKWGSKIRVLMTKTSSPEFDVCTFSFIPLPDNTPVLLNNN
jgi:hypothetical protein